MWERSGGGTIVAAELSPDRYLVSVGGTLDDPAGASLRDVLLPLAGADHTGILLDLGGTAFDAFDPVPMLVDVAAIAASSGGTLTVVTTDRRLRALLEADERVTVELRLEEHLL